MDNTFYISNGEDALGPYEKGQLRSMWSTGQITANSLYWNEENNEWRNIAELALGGAGPTATSVVSPTATKKPVVASLSFKEKNPMGYWMSWIGGIGFGIAFLAGIAQSIESVGLVRSIAFSIGYGVPWFLIFAAIGAIVGLVVKKRRK